MKERHNNLRIRNGRNSNSYRELAPEINRAKMESCYSDDRKKNGRYMISLLYYIVDDDQKYKME